jgi:hypothetical protein
MWSSSIFYDLTFLDESEEIFVDDGATFVESL